jgi:hypothetical protein
MIAVGHARTVDGTPTIIEKAYPTSERIFGEWGPSPVEEDRTAGRTMFYDTVGGWENSPQRRYSHSSADLT